MIELIVKYVGIAVIIVLVNIILSRRKQCSTWANPNIVHEPRLYLWVGIVDITLFLSALLLSNVFPNGTQTWWTSTIFLFFTILGALILLMYFNWYIIIKEDTFIYSTIFGRRYEILFKDINKVRRSEHYIHLYTEQKHCYIDRNAIGIQELINKMSLFIGRTKI